MMNDNVSSDTLSLLDVQLVQVGLNQISGQQFLVGEIDNANLSTEAKFAFENEFLIYLVSNILELKGPLGEMAKLSATAVIVFKAPRLIGEDDKQLVTDVGAATLMIAHPVLREALSDLANKLGLPRITLGLLRVGQERPETVTIGEKIYNFDLPKVADSSES